MVYSFKAVIQKVGINPCVDVPKKISSQLIARRGYIPILGKVNGHPIQQHLVPVKNGPYRLYVNGPMMKGANVKVGESAKFEIEQDDPTPKKLPMPVQLRRKLKETGLMTIFDTLIPSRQKEIIKYLSSLKTEEARERNIEKVVKMLEEKRK